MCRKAPVRLHRMRKIVMLVAYVWRRMLEHTWNQPDHLRYIHGQESRCRTAKVMKTHVLSKLGKDPRSHDVIQSARAQRAFVV